QEIDNSLPQSHQQYLGQKEYENLLSHTLEQLGEFQVLNVIEGVVKIQLGAYPYSFSLLPVVEQVAEFGFNSTQSNDLVNEYVMMLRSAYEDQQLLSEADFSTVKKYLKLQLYPGGAMEGEDETRWVSRTDLEGTVTCAVLDLPTAVATVEHHQLEKWLVAEDDIWQIAEQNTIVPYETVRKTVADSIDLLAIGSANATLVLEEVIPDSIGEYGAIVAVPHEEIALIHNLKADNLANFQTVVEHLYDFVSSQYQRHTDPVSPYFYWYAESRYIRIRLGKDQHGKLHIFPPVAMDWSAGG
ncbi:MAG: hypothetical protein AAF632_28725, partial [Bacteroidota bacterium]